MGTLAADLDPDSLLEQLLGLHDGTDAASNAPEGCDLWADVFSRPKLRLEAAISRTLLDGARHRLAAQACERVIAVAPTDELGCRHTEAIALARLEDEEGFDQLDARFGRHDNAWTSLSRCVLMYKLGRMSAARRALAGFDRLCQGGSYALMRPVFVEVYLPDRPPVAVNSLEEATLAVHEMEPTIADVPDFINCRRPARHLRQRRGLCPAQRPGLVAGIGDGAGRALCSDLAPAGRRFCARSPKCFSALKFCLHWRATLSKCTENRLARKYGLQWKAVLRKAPRRTSSNWGRVRFCANLNTSLI